MLQEFPQSLIYVLKYKPNAMSDPVPESTPQSADNNAKEVPSDVIKTDVGSEQVPGASGEPPRGADDVPKVSNSLSASVTSLDSVGTTSSVKSFKSGIRPPSSRIGRLCGGTHKPAVPTTPTKSE